LSGGTEKGLLSHTVIVDYGTGNLQSVKRALDRFGAKTVISIEPGDIKKADKIILPGVGHFGRAMEALLERDLVEALNEAVMAKGKPVLGICLGMELMARKSEEGNAAGLGWIDAELVRFDLPKNSGFKVPHMGWNQVRTRRSCPLFDAVNNEAEFYFAHSYHLKLNDESDLLSETDYGITFPSAIAKGNVFGVQYHPEKSHGAGAQILRNFVEM
jgi:imidazole glycerol-phosphate synthase subunit HisH